ncbi:MULTISPECIES: class I SAM-dependent DNA methyltransferase [unclassified Polaromonas]|jgi:type I restriction enzyme M protein|uniref:type I restriction-modification system subunit M n=1 Tax=unclassified Polaromonas TaxID=2638319 RepID=UPI000BC394AC|nr:MULTISPECIES: class I SAM-dependent DNA methyltransferase [unclassified Polaromonas]OYY34812.1 MAG: N-6 DNA methylase [Polaromonas sp. 35-63-35]OYZ19303.1 MAG: N-6 DNA methylase [Polaromonas sp. 16-63-31]OYZ77573.1 MAG: N-6 DNA methylase [Polaromonas sp. 24-63-21]OZA48445.1 MAG: N-6 DNA methylase [Polaromonas sp. 17-63-33]OZA87193.1 MAG: N-6 DNA methylase [Polaromonas sp. 39-63-25]
MITGELKNRIDSLWTEFWTGGITNPLTVIEQITFLMYSRLLDMQERKDEKRGSVTRKPHLSRFGEADQDCRWETWRHYGADEMLPHVRDKVFPHFRRLAERSTGVGSQFAAFMKDAQLMIQKPTLLVKAVNAVQDLPLERGDTKGDLYEYLLSKLTTAGINGQFRTPRHIIRMMVELMQPQPTDRICDPSCGTAGFLIEAYDYLLRQHTSEAGKHVEVIDGEEHITYSGDLLGEHRQHVDSDMFHAYDFDATMLRIATMNLVMHGVAEPDVHYQDTLSQSFEERHPKGSKDAFNLILANPPFKGTLDELDVAPDILRTVKTKKTELLFIALILRMLKVGGRSATIVPDGVLFGSSKAHVQLRHHLIENNQLEAVISLPSGVFKPYAGVSTAIIVFAKGGKTENVFFYDVQADGFTLDDKRNRIGNGKGDLPDVQAKYLQWCDGKSDFSDRTAKAFEVSADDIRAQSYDLSINRYKVTKHVADKHDDPIQILGRLKELEAAIMRDLSELEGLLT